MILNIYWQSRDNTYALYGRRAEDGRVRQQSDAAKQYLAGECRVANP